MREHILYAMNITNKISVSFENKRRQLKFFLYSAPNMVKINAMLRVKSQYQKLLKIFIRLFPAIGVIVSPISVKSTLIVLHKFYQIYSKQGKVGLVKYLKVCSVCLQQSIGGHVLKDLNPLGPRVKRTKRGIPRVIPIYHRNMIREGRPEIIRLYLTLFALFRIINIPAKVKLGTITDPFNGRDPEFLDSYLSRFNSLFIQPTIKGIPVFERMSEYGGMFPIWKSSPGTSKEDGPNPYSSHPLTMIVTGISLMRDSELKKSILYLLEQYLPIEDPFIGRVSIRNKKFGTVAKIISLLKRIDEMGPVRIPGVKVPKDLGKLALKHEPAGKMRVFAMVDPWTQWALKPLHELIFFILKHYKTDGTFDQMRPIHNLLQNSSELYSLDLSSATDRLPISLQQKLLEEFTSSSYALAWKTLLVERTYSVPLKANTGIKSVKYAVGQPMGALSSWAMLALTHHFLVQSAYWRAYPHNIENLYTGYAILGDDLVINDSLVKDQYLEILEELGVECGLHKSLLSPTGTALEFAKRTFYKGVDVSPISLTEFYAANGSLSEIISFMRKYQLKLPQVARTLGFGWRVISQTNKPISKQNSVLRGVQVASIIPTTKESIIELFSLGKALIPDHYQFLTLFVQYEFGHMAKTLDDLIKNKLRFPSYDSVFGFELPKSMELPLYTARSIMKDMLDELLKPIIYPNHYLIQELQYKVKTPSRRGDLPEIYAEFLNLSTRLGAVNLDQLKLTMVRGKEVRRGVSPLQLQLWNRWSPIFQGLSFKLVQPTSRAILASTDAKDTIKFSDETK